MKPKFESIPGCHILPGHLVHCTRCGAEYPSTDMVYGRRLGGVWRWWCAKDDCYGRGVDIYEVSVESA